ncbi:uncharacterized protein LOC112599199 [Melanaphis sacchari]|uniref:uncharacterized protein LOC112599199 n=1 Tax=Melanaphis sacchari TaxID=742174 RepID=UPI000DC14FC1|nr:uncharacterized protein LOC112599199 [Melanaphis sacchari]
MTSKFSVSSPLVEKFLLLVKNNPILYNVLDVNYENISLRNSIWKDISHKIEKSVDETKQMWENIRNLYSKIIARKLETGLYFNRKKIWILTYRLRFLEQYECNQFLTFNITITEMHKPSKPSTFHKKKGIVKMINKTESDLPIKTIIKNHRVSKFNQNDENVDDMDLFFENFSIKAKQFPSTGRTEMKMKMCALMNELEDKYLIIEPSLSPRLNQPIYLFKNVHISTEENDYSSMSSIQSCASTLPSLHSESESS